MNLMRFARIMAVFACSTAVSFLFFAAPKGIVKAGYRKNFTSQANYNDLEEAETKKVKVRTKAYNWSAAATRFHLRKEHLRGKCGWKAETFLKRTWKTNSNFLVDVPNRLMICAVPKSGTTSWHRTLWTLQREKDNLSTNQSLYTYKDTVHNQGMAKKLSVTDGTKLVRHVPGDDRFWNDPPENSSFRLILARHPFARIISGWNQKFMLQSNYWVYLFKTHKRMLEYKKEIVEDYVMSFGDFTDFVVNIGSGALDFHFIPASTLCQPCIYDYTYIVKAESIDADEPWLMRRLNLTRINVGRKGVPPGGSVVNGDLVENIRKYMKLVKPLTLRRLYQFYKPDFDFFGYTFNFTTLEAGGFD